MLKMPNGASWERPDQINYGVDEVQRVYLYDEPHSVDIIVWDRERQVTLTDTCSEGSPGSTINLKSLIIQDQLIVQGVKKFKFIVPAGTKVGPITTGTWNTSDENDPDFYEVKLVVESGGYISGSTSSKNAVTLTSALQLLNYGTIRSAGGKGGEGADSTISYIYGGWGAWSGNTWSAGVCSGISGTMGAPYCNRNVWGGSVATNSSTVEYALGGFHCIGIVYGCCGYGGYLYNMKRRLRNKTNISPSRRYGGHGGNGQACDNATANNGTAGQTSSTSSSYNAGAGGRGGNWGANGSNGAKAANGDNTGRSNGGAAGRSISGKSRIKPDSTWGTLIGPTA